MSQKTDSRKVKGVYNVYYNGRRIDRIHGCSSEQNAIGVLLREAEEWEIFSSKKSGLKCGCHHCVPKRAQNK